MQLFFSIIEFALRLKLKDQQRKVLLKYLNCMLIKLQQELINLLIIHIPPDCKKLKGLDEDQYCVRVGQYRVVYEVHEDELLILVVKTGHRKDVYR